MYVVISGGVFYHLAAGKVHKMSSQQYILEPQDRDSDGGTGDKVRLLYVTSAQYSDEWNSTLHTHACAELFFITGGHGVFQVWQEQFPVAINDLVVVNTSIPHTETSHAGSPMEYMVLGVEGLEALTSIRGCVLLHLAEEQAAVRDCLRIMQQEIREQQPGCGEICQSLLDVILLRLLRREDFALAGSPAGPRAGQNCDLVRRYIDNHFKENLTLEQLAEMVHISKYHLSHTFQKEFHTSPISYLIARRIQESRFLLRETDLSVSQIAQILGFSSLSYFSQSFRKLEGVSPIEYRKLASR